MTRFVIPMPGWSAPVAATSTHRGFFISGCRSQRSMTSRASSIPLACMRRKQLRRHRSIGAGRQRFLEHALRIAPVQLVCFGQQDMGEAVSATAPIRASPTSWAPKPRRLSTIKIRPTSDSRTLK